MAFPAARFTPATDAIELRVPAELTRQPPPSVPAPAPGPSGPAAAPAGQDSGNSGHGRAMELDREVPPSGSLWIAGQQIWLGPAMTGRTVRLWAGLSQVSVGPDTYQIAVETGITVTAARTSSRDIRRRKASRY